MLVVPRTVLVGELAIELGRLAFLVARYLASDWVAARSGGRLRQLIHGVETEGWRFVAFVRLVPLFPFNLLNYALGLTRIRFSHYLIATYVCMLPGAFAYTYLGYAGREAVGGGEGLIQKAPEEGETRVPLIVLTNSAAQGCVDNAVRAIESLDDIAGEIARIRVEALDG